MQPVLNVEDVRKVEQDLTLEGVSLAELMRRAGHAVAQEVLDLGNLGPVVVLCGTGNNGGDGWVAAELMAKAGAQVEVMTPVEPESLKSPLALMVAQSAVNAGVPFFVAPSRDELDAHLAQAAVVVDALLGTGFHGEPAAPFDIWIDAVNASGAHVVAVDVPSGLSAQTGHAPGGAVFADTTVTMICLKPGLLSGRGRDVCGAIVLAPLAEQAERLVVEADPVAWRCDTADYLETLREPTADVDKYSRGSVLVVGGSTRFPGAAVMAAMAAARSGAGYVTLVVPDRIATVCRTHLLEIPVVGLPTNEEGMLSAGARTEIVKMAEQRSCVLCGPGMGVCADTVSVVSSLLECDVPLVLDADALNALSRMTTNRLDNFPELIRREAPLVLTPHRRELGRLVGQPGEPPSSLTAALEAARRIVWADGGSDICVVTKGESTGCVGVEIALLPKPGPACLATAGSGDVLGGIMAALLARGVVENDVLPLVCAFACEVHGFAANLAAEAHGSRGVMASDLIGNLGLALDAMEEQVSLAAAGVSPEEGE
ncbi:NAD(P)H-hydrate dehydratase [Granulimonas faecalis]|uniref:NAD(P)H-hydrate dehydratase n=1 Tax=Granulimonas faecalis TaxID=2894155 RepID=UPI0035121ABF